MIYKGIKAFEDVGDINLKSNTIQPVWSHFSKAESYSPSTPLPLLENFITALSLKKDAWTKTAEAKKLFFVHLR